MLRIGNVVSLSALAQEQLSLSCRGKNSLKYGAIPHKTRGQTRGDINFVSCSVDHLQQSGNGVSGRTARIIFLSAELRLSYIKILPHQCLQNGLRHRALQPLEPTPHYRGVLWSRETKALIVSQLTATISGLSRLFCPLRGSGHWQIPKESKLSPTFEHLMLRKPGLILRAI
jgi:hypothetical protein